MLLPHRTTKAVAAVEHGFLYRLFNNVIAPLFLISTTSFFVPFLWYTNYHLDGSYENLVQFFVEHGVVDVRPTCRLLSPPLTRHRRP
mgnify:CR=1 FL=1